MNIALLGDGEAFYEMAQKIDKGGHRILAMATNKHSIIKINKLESLQFFPKIYPSHEEIIENETNIDCILMYSYSPLIKREHFEKVNFINVHFALLPRYRGFHGFIWSMINDESLMGYSIFLVNQVIDGGDIYYQHAIPVDDSMDINYVRNSIEKHLLNNIAQYLTGIEQGRTAIPQNEADAIYVTKRKAEDGLINWNWPSRLIFNHVRALKPPATPGAYTFYRNNKVVILQAEQMVKQHNYFMKTGRIVNIYHDGAIAVKCGDGIIKIAKIEIDGIEYLPGSYFSRVGMQLKEEASE